MATETALLATRCSEWRRDGPLTERVEGLSPDEVDAAVSVLTLRVGPARLRRALHAVDEKKRGNETVEAIVAQAEMGARRKVLPDEDIPRLLVDLLGDRLLAIRAVRSAVLMSATDEQIRALLEAGSMRVHPDRHVNTTDAANRKWLPGRYWAKTFCRILDLPEPLAGVPGEPDEPDLLEVRPFVPLADLAPFQAEMHEGLLEAMLAAPGQNRAILAMPTGSGKTRTAAEALLEWYRRMGEKGILLWIAHSGELCEQAVQAFREIWVDLGHRHGPVRSDLGIWRLWNTHDSLPDRGGVVVASVQKLHSMARDEQRDLHQQMRAIVPRIGVVVIDEAHRALAPSYGQVLGMLGVPPSATATETSLIGLTATPFRTGTGQTASLLGRFHKRVLTPSHPADCTLTDHLRGMMVLSSVATEVLEYNTDQVNLSDDPKHSEYFTTFEDVPPDVLTRLGSSAVRNRALRDRILEIDPDWPTLVFASSVAQARAMTVMLNRRGRRTGCVLGSTRASNRRSLIEEFRAGELSVLCNYGVLTTGFDAPRIRAILVARPTASPVLYHQMVGRGMRGRRFGGTDETLVIDVQDNIRFQGQDVAVTMEALAEHEL